MSSERELSEAQIRKRLKDLPHFDENYPSNIMAQIDVRELAWLYKKALSALASPSVGELDAKLEAKIRNVCQEVANLMAWHTESARERGKTPEGRTITALDLAARDLWAQLPPPNLTR